MLIAVGSCNPVKVRAVREVFEKFFGHVNVAYVECLTSVGPQPIGLRKTVLGAIERAIFALKKVPNADYGVGIEAGLVQFPATMTGYIDQQVCAIVDKSMKVTIGTSAGFEFPPLAVEKVLSGEVKELGEIMEKISGVKQIGRREGAIGFLTKNTVTRLDLTVQAVTMALVPRLNKDLYPAILLKNAEDVMRELKET